MYKIKPEVQRDIFQKLINNYNGSIKASSALGIPASSIRGYKNLYFDSIPKDLLDKLAELKIINTHELKENVLLKFNKNQQIQEILKNGRRIRNQKLKRWKQEIPKLTEILNLNNLDFEKWLFSYQRLIDFGVRKFNYMKREKNYIEASYIMHSKKEKKEFVVRFPRKIKLDNEFVYFLNSFFNNLW